jgi:hypothetical protein
MMYRDTVCGLTIDQIELLISFYEDATGRKARDIGTAALYAAPVPDPDYKSPGMPEDYETVVGYLSQYEARVWELMDHYAEVTQRDGWWLMHRARERNLNVYKVQACPWLIRQGIFEVNAYPISLLRERFSSQT